MFTIVSAGNNCFVLVSCKYREIFLFSSYQGQFDTLGFHKEVNSINADESSPLVPMRCSLVSNGNLILSFFYTRVNSITALKLSAVVPRILNKKEAFISRRFLRLCSSSLFIFDEHFMTLFSVRYF